MDPMNGLSLQLKEVFLPPPDTVVMSQQHLQVLKQWLQAALPHEGCALLLGCRHGGTLVLERLWPCRNVWHPGWPGAADDEAGDGPPPSQHRRGRADDHDRTDRFAVDPRELLAAQKACRDWSLQLLGVAHSHPGGSGRPSFTDRCHGWDGALMLIQPLPLEAAPPPPCCWWGERPGDQLEGPLDCYPLQLLTQG
ncbi:MAG: M67 family peptidase [Aphanocapsa feldmannii 277cV]|uniref:M67 family peptidase n=2 Tax=Aphanocapsa feldmannii TaxID=192050 RepID=A0A524RMK2_9CHRO|nr:MAG: M67 family peptidase [Aphanocapsa feldmannii 277cV]TGH22727.1 MAG: M67 family peptidase [Aphanocapsa feldmannii 277cI]